MSNPFASAVNACFRLYKTSQTIGSRPLFDAVNDAFCQAAYVQHGR